MENYRNQIYNMDCIAGMSLLPDNSVDMLLTDLPYHVNSSYLLVVSAQKRG